VKFRRLDDDSDFTLADSPMNTSLEPIVVDGDGEGEVTFGRAAEASEAGHVVVDVGLTKMNLANWVLAAVLIPGLLIKVSCVGVFAALVLHNDGTIMLDLTRDV